MISFIFIRVIILLIISIQCDASTYTCDKNIVPCGCGQITAEINARIVNGENSIPYSWPMMVSLRVDVDLSRHICGGTILSESYILTAAHCVDMFSDSFPFGNLTIAAGIHNLSQPDGIIRQVDKIIIHHLWKEFHYDIQYDIAILHLAEPLNLTRSSPLTRTCLPPHLNTLEEMMQYPSNGTRLVVTGWGALETTGSSPDILQQVTMYSMHHFDSICATSLRDPSIQFCAGLYEGGKSACYGDSGGPIFQWIGDRWEQVGIVSYGEMGCGTKGYPAVFTRISYFHDWIQSHIHNSNSTNISDNTTTNDRTLYECSGECGCGRRNVALSSSTIVKSENALPHSWSMVVSIRGGTNHQHICSGTILEDFYVLTSAHCIANQSLQDITIEAGMYYQSESNAIIRQVNRISIHPNYTIHSNSLMNDIAILQVTMPFYIKDDRFVSRICLPSEYDDEIDLSKYPSNITPLAVVGWNIRNMSTSSTPKILQQAKVYVMDSENSNCSLSADQRSRQFCAGRYGNDTEICNGDDGFGDPIFQWTSRSWVQVGLGSYCGMSDKRAIFTNLAAYSGWIKSIVNATIKTSSNIYQCDKKAPCGCGRIDVNLSISGMVGAETAQKYSWPMIISVQYDGRHRCGGTILSDSFILTSARCIAFNRYIDNSYAPNMTILVGVNDLLGSVTIRRQIDKTFIHPNFLSSQPDLHDIAIVHLGQPLPLDDLSSTLARTCLPEMSESLTDDYLKPNSPLVAIGWDGYIYEDDILQSLQQLSVRTLDHEHALCSNFINNNTYQFCAEPPSSSGSRYKGYLCEGGSGGPVLMYKNNRWEQVGITPYTVACDYAGRLRVYTRVSPYVEWMKNIMNSSTATTQPSTTTTQPSTATNQRRNTFIFEILFILIIMFL